MCERGCGRRVSEIVCWDVNCLNGCDGTLFRRSNTLLETTQVGCKSWLVAYSGWNPAKQGRYFRVGLREAENIVNEEKDILALKVTEILSHSQTGQTNPCSCSGRLVHLSVHQRALGIFRLIAEFDNSSFNHFVIQIVPFSGSFANARKHGKSAMPLRDIIDQLHDENGFAHSSTTKKSNFPSFLIWSKKIDHLDSSYKHFHFCALVNERRSFAMDRQQRLRHCVEE
mmetsp:Transcript_5578/g.21866  ORF Transcript_5578/g.21866 Transcript_5578/m.21866 type:complete len:227 (+) Transcript_5578:1935-2615(+)